MSKAKELEKKYEEAIDRVYKIAEENSPLRVKAEYIGCKGCGSRLAKRYIRQSYKYCKCPVCGCSLFSNTAQERIRKADGKAEKAKKEWQNAAAKEAAEERPTFEKSVESVRDRLDYVMEEHKDPDFLEIIGKMGGDVITFRVYKDGTVYEK